MIPLSTNSGLIGWVPHCDTLHSLIRDYREKKKILLNIEHRIMLRVSGSLHFIFLIGFLMSAILLLDGAGLRSPVPHAKSGSV